MEIHNYIKIAYLGNQSRKRKSASKLLVVSLILLLSLGIFTAFYHISVFYYKNNSFQEKKSENLISLPQVLGTNAPTLPVRLIIPRIRVDADITFVGVTSDGQMEVPSSITDVGWFKLGARPGEKGSAVISGHVDGKQGENGVFADLHQLKQGDKLYIEDNQGKLITFIVRESRSYEPGHADDVFIPNDNAYLNLITCEGVWDSAKQSFSKRLVIFANIVD